MYIVQVRHIQDKNAKRYTYKLLEYIKFISLKLNPK